MTNNSFILEKKIPQLFFKERGGGGGKLLLFPESPFQYLKIVLLISCGLALAKTWLFVSSVPCFSFVKSRLGLVHAQEVADVLCI